MAPRVGVSRCAAWHKPLSRPWLRGPGRGDAPRRSVLRVRGDAWPSHPCGGVGDAHAGHLCRLNPGCRHRVLIAQSPVGGAAGRTRGKQPSIPLAARRSPPRGRTQDALEDAPSALELEWAEGAQLLGAWGGIREGFMEEVEFELRLQGQSNKHFQGTDPRDPSLLFSSLYRQVPDSRAVTLQGGAIGSLSVTCRPSGS